MRKFYPSLVKEFFSGNKKYVLLLLLVNSSLTLFAQPSISSFSPTLGPVGTTVTITGNNFSPTPSNNIVFFGAVRATVTSSSATSLSVQVPSGATYQPITVTTNNLTCYTAKPFIVTFPDGVIHSKSFSSAGKADSLYNVETDDFEFGDLDGDGLADLAAVDRYNNTLSIYRNTSAGEISFSNRINFRTGDQPTGLALGDVDGDGKVDIAVSNQYGNTVSVFKNTSLSGTISFATKIDFATATQPNDLIFDDLDGDGKTDLAIACINLEGSVSLLRNTTSSERISFAPKFDLVISLGISAIAAAKLDGDARPDLVFTGSYTDKILVAKNNSSPGSFSFTAATTQTTGRYPAKLAIGDLDGDGSSDIAVSNFFGNTISIFRNTTVGSSISFSSKVDYPTYSADGIAIGDLDGDSKPDLAVTSTYVGIDVFENNSTPGNISLLSKQGYTNNAVANQMAIADLNNDGKADLAVESGIFRVFFWKNDVTKPSISSFTPTTAGTGTTVTITGYNFNGATSVSFGGVSATSFTANSTTITAVMGAAFSGDITVVTPNGTALISGFAFAGPPLISSFTPTTANRQTTVTINGKNFTGITSVKFGGMGATAITVVSPTIITAVAGNGTSGDVSVTNAYGTGSLGGFNFIPPPTITSFSPTGALSGETVTITGTNLNGATAVSFGGTPSISFTVVSPTTINAVVGSGTSGNITVVTPGGSASKSGFGILPTISSFTPTTGARGTNVTITGTNFSEITGVRFGGANASFTVNSSTSISAIVGGGNSGDVSLVTAAGTVSKPGFTFIPEPTLSSFTPKITGAGGTVTITGTNLSTTTAVSFGGVAATSFTIINSTTITAVVASGASGNIEVITTGGNASLSGFQFLTTPIINSLSPASGPVGTVVTIMGANFNSTASNNIVFFGGVKANVISGTANKLTVKVPAGANYQPISVTTNGKTAQSMSSFAVTFPGVDAFNANSFAGGVDFATGGSPEGIACGDLDGDGKPDVVVANTYANTISFFRNTSTLNSLSFAPSVDSAAGLYPHAVKIADIDCDGRLDVLFLNFGSGGLVNTITIFKNLSTVGNLSFQSKFVLKTDFHPQDMAIADLDMDGKLDIAITHFGTSTSAGEYISVFANSSTSELLSFRLSGKIVTTDDTLSGLFFETSISSADMDNDGRPNLVVGFSNGDFIFVTGSTANKCFGGCWYGPGYAYVSPADFDGDGKTDVITNDHIFRNAFNGMSLMFDWQSSRRGIGGVLAIDNLSGNSLPDFVRINPSANTISAVKNLSTVGSISFAANVDYNTATTPGGIATADFNGDGKADVAITNKHFNTFSVLLNSIGNSGPSLNSFFPTSGNAGTEVTITGTNLTGVTGVSFGGVPASSFAVVNSATIKAIVGNGASGNISVTTATDTISLGWFYYTPSVISFNPTNAGTGITVTITGNNFTGATAVSFGGVEASSFTILSPTTIAAVVAGGTSGNISVTTPAGTATASGFIYVAAPTITSFTPATGGTGTVVTITGTNFLGATSVRFGDKQASSFTVTSPTTIEAIVGNGSTGNIFVTTPGGVANSTIFTFDRTPYITAFNPVIGGIGTSVTITGSNLIGATAVSFGGIPATSFTINSATSITAIVGAGASGNVSVTTPDGTATLAGFTFIPTPTITSFTPTSAVSGATVTINGNNFVGATAVSFGGTLATSFTVNSATSIIATVGAGSSGSVNVTTPGGTATLAGFTFIPALSITSFTPTSAASGAIVTITGTNFTGATAVSFGGIAVTSFTVNSLTRITATVATGASGNVSVTTPGGTATLGGFTFIAAPTITSFTPTSAESGTTVTITGANLTGATAVNFGSIAATSFTVNSPTSITATVGAGATGDVTVTTPGGTTTLGGFTFISAPTIISFTPTSAESGATITITGTNLTGATAVNFGGVATTSFTVNSPTSITTAVGTGASGNVSVTTPGGTATLGGFTFISAPTITSFTPTAAASGATVTITGTDFAGATAVSFGGTAATSFIVNSPTSITATVGSGASGNVSVTTPGGTTTLGGFTFISAPTITSFTPTSAESGAIVTITGTNLTGATAVNFGGVAATSFTVNSSTSITAIVGAGATGDVTVTTPDGTATLSGFAFKAGRPVTGDEPAILLYPNPVSGTFTIDSLKLPNQWETLQILDADGRKALADINIRNQEKVTIDVKYLKSGLYFAWLKRKNGPPAVVRFLKL